MRRWARADHEVLCGYCQHRIIKKDDPICFVKVGRVERELRRCVDCAGPAPPDLPASIRIKEPGDYSMVAVGSMKPKTRGELRKQVKEWTPYREPGSDDD